MKLIDADKFLEEIDSLTKHYICREDYDIGYNQAIDDVKKVADSLQEESVSEDLEEVCEQLAENARKHKAETSSPFFSPTDYKQGVIDGAKWQEEQFEKERLKHCDELTPEQAQIESDFVTQHLKKNNRTPTFIDAIEYGMKLQKERDKETIELAEDHAMFAGIERGRQQIIQKACDAYCKVCGHFAHTTPTHICRHDCQYYSDFKKAMEG